MTLGFDHNQIKFFIGGTENSMVYNRCQLHFLADGQLQEVDAQEHCLSVERENDLRSALILDFDSLIIQNVRGAIKPSTEQSRRNLLDHED
jgi:hypothetical protein